MKQRWSHLRVWWKNAVEGRYGTDELTQFLIHTAIVILLFSLIRPLRPLYVISFMIMLWAVIRCYSKNMEKRYAERDRFLRYRQEIADEQAFRRRRWRDRKTHKYYRCKRCRAILRVPRGKGKIELRCPRCGASMIRKS